MEKMISQYLDHYSGLNKTTWYMILLKFFNSILISLYYFLPIYFVIKLNISISTAGIIVSSYGLGTVIGGYLGGKLSDKLSPFLVCIAALLLQGLAFSSLPYISAPYLLMINLFIAGIATYSLLTSTYILTLSTCQKNRLQRLKAINILDTTSNLGLGISALFISTVGATHLTNLYAAAGLISASIAAYFSFNFKKLNISITREQLTANGEKKLSENKTNRTVLQFVYVSLFLSGFIISQLSSTYSIYLSQLFPNKNFGGFGIIFTLNTFLIVIMQTPVANYCSKYNYIIVAGIGTFLLGFGLALLNLSSSFGFILITCIIYTIGEMLFFSVSQLICYEYAEGNKKGAALGIYRLIYAASRVAGPMTGSYIYNQFNGDTLWNICGLIGLFCLMIAFLVKNKFLIRANTDTTSYKS